MGVRNYLIEGVSGTGKTSVCDELLRRGYHAIHGDRDLCYRADPATGEPVDGAGREHDAQFVHDHHLWRVDKVEALVTDQRRPVSFFCGGSRNFPRFVDLFDDVFVLDVDADTLKERLDARTEGEWGARASERNLTMRVHVTGEDVPQNGTRIDATAPLARVVDEILAKCGVDPPTPGPS